MQHGKFVVKTKTTKYSKDKFDKLVEADKIKSNKMKHRDKALWRSMKQESQEDFDNILIDEDF